MRGELNLLARELQLLAKFAGVAVVEDRVGGEVAGGIHEVRSGRGQLASTGDAGLGVGDDADLEVNEVGANEWSETEDDRGRIAARVGDEARGPDLSGVQLGRTIDGLGLQLRGAFRVSVVQLVDGAILRVLQAPGGGEVDDANAMRESDGRELAGLLMRQREKEDVDAFFG